MAGASRNGASGSEKEGSARRSYNRTSTVAESYCTYHTRRRTHARNLQSRSHPSCTVPTMEKPLLPPESNTVVPPTAPSRSFEALATSAHTQTTAWRFYCLAVCTGIAGIQERSGTILDPLLRSWHLITIGATPPSRCSQIGARSAISSQLFPRRGSLMNSVCV